MDEHMNKNPVIVKCNHPMSALVACISANITAFSMGWERTGLGTVAQINTVGNEVKVAIQSYIVGIRAKLSGGISDEVWRDCKRVLVEAVNKGMRYDLGQGPWPGDMRKDVEKVWDKINVGYRRAVEESQINVIDGISHNWYQKDGDLKNIYIGSEDFIFQIECDEVHMDADKKLHNLKGPSMRFCGFKTYHVEGVRVTAKIVEFPEHLDEFDIEECKNNEVRRIIIKQMGMEKYLEVGKAKILDIDSHKFNFTRCLYTSKYGTFMQCVCPSTGRVYWLYVPDTCATCEQADEFLRSGLWLKNGKQIGRT